MSVKNEISTSIVLRGQLDQIKFSELEDNAKVIKTQKLKNFVLGELRQIKADVQSIRSALEVSENLPYVWLNTEVKTITSKLPKNLPKNCWMSSESDCELFKHIFKEVKQVLNAIEQRSSTLEKVPNKVIEEELAMEQALFVEQEELSSNLHFCAQLESFAVLLSRKTSPKVFMAYAWPVDEHQERETKVQRFLRILQTHLELLGMRPKLDVKHCSKGSDIYGYINKKINKANTVLFFGTESLLVKHRDSRGIPIVCSELNLVLSNVREAIEEEKSLRPKLLPILLTGSMERSFPQNFRGHFNTLLLPELGYYKGIRALVYSLYGLQGQGVTKDTFEQAWEEHFEMAELKTEKEVSSVKGKQISIKQKNSLDIEKSVGTMQEEKSKLYEQVPLTPARVEKIVTLETGIPKFLKKTVFGKADWEKYFGEVVEEPPLPPNIEEILKSVCPFWPDKRVEETHILVLIPQTVDGVPLTLNSLSELIKATKHGFATQYRNYNDFVRKEYGDRVATSSHWVMLTKDVIPNSRKKSFSDQYKEIAEYGDYEVPQLLDTVVGILMHHAKTGERIYSDEPMTITKCRELINNKWHMVVGGFLPGSFYISYNVHNCHDNNSISVGMGGSRKF